MKRQEGQDHSDGDRWQRKEGDDNSKDQIRKQYKEMISYMQSGTLVPLCFCILNEKGGAVSKSELTVSSNIRKN